MDVSFIELIGAICSGGILVKILDIIWLQKALEKNERKKWYREQKLRVYSELSKELMSLGTYRGTRENAFKGYSFIAEAILLVDDNELGKRLEQFFTKMYNLYQKGLMEEPNVPEEELNKAYNTIVNESRELVLALRKSFRKV